MSLLKNAASIALASLPFSLPADADIVRFTFRGEITEISGPLPPPPEISVGDPYSITYVFDTATPDTEPDPQAGNFTGAILRGAIDVNGYRADFRAGDINTLNDGFAGDSYQGRLVHPLQTASINLTNLGGGQFSGDAIPADLVFDEWQLRDFFLEITRGPGFTLVQGNVRDFARIVITCACDWDFDGALNSQDFFAFISDFFLADADFNRDGVTDSADFFDYLTCFFGACA